MGLMPYAGVNNATHPLEGGPDSTWHNVKWPEGRIIVGFRGVEGRTWVKARALLDYAGQRPT